MTTPKPREFWLAEYETTKRRKRWHGFDTEDVEGRGPLIHVIEYEALNVMSDRYAQLQDKYLAERERNRKLVEVYDQAINMIEHHIRVVGNKNVGSLNSAISILKKAATENGGEGE